MLKKIQKLLIENDQPCLFKKGDSTNPNDRLLVALSTPQEGDENILEITEFPQAFQGISSKETSDTHLVQFQFTLPIDITPHTFNQVSSALHFFNRLLHCPGFELDELNNQVIYRYCWFIKKAALDPSLLQQVIGNISLCYKMFIPYIKEIALGKYTLEEILEKVLELTKKNS